LFKVANYSAMSKEEREKYEESLKYYNDLKNSLDTAFDEGKEEAYLELMPIIEQERQKAEQKEKQLEIERQKAEQKEKQLEIERQKVIKTVKNMQKDGLSIELIMKYTGLSKDEINKII